MDRRELLVGMAALVPMAAVGQSKSLHERLLGAWRIRDAETVNVTTGASKPWLGRPRPYVGVLMYLPNGLVSVQIGSARPPVRAAAGFEDLSKDELRAYAESWYGYYGHFEIDEAKSLVRHVIEGSLFAFETGKILERIVQLEGDVLTLRTVNLQKEPGGDTFNRLVWTRIP